MRQSIAHITLVVRDYDEAIRFYVDKLNFDLLEDSYQAEQMAFIGNQAGGRVQGPVRESVGPGPVQARPSHGQALVG